MAHTTIRRIGLQLIADKKADILVTQQPSSEKTRAGSEHWTHSRDLLTLLIKANMEPDPASGDSVHQRMSDAEVLGRA